MGSRIEEPRSKGARQWRRWLDRGQGLERTMGFRGDEGFGSGLATRTTEGLVGGGG